MSDACHVWVIDDDKSIRWVLEKALQKANMQATCFSSAEGIIQKLEQQQPDVILSDVRMPGVDGLTMLEQINGIYPNLPVIIMTAHSDLESAVAAFHRGAFEYLPKPFDLNEVIIQITRACRKNKTTEKKPFTKIKSNITKIIGEAPAMQEVFRAIGRLARSNITVLINGASGTGKELVALALHKHSPRKDKAFIALNMAAIPKDLMESELFGHERGAFTGAQSRRPGRFEQANGGTLFLDEIGDMPAELQTRLLRVLSDGQYYRVGGHESIQSDVRIIAATHQNLEQLVSDGRFREDLFHRLNVIRIHIPALCERKEDIPILMNHFLAKAAKELDVEIKHLLPDTEKALQQFPWPGNVRQLENTARWLTVMASSQEIHTEDLPTEFTNTNTNTNTIESPVNDWQGALQHWVQLQLDQGENNILDKAIPIFEEILITTVLQHTSGKKQEAAKLLGWGRNTLTRKIKELSL